MIEPGDTSPLRPHQDDDGRDQLDEGVGSYLRGRRGAQFNEKQDAHFDETRGARAEGGRAGLNSPAGFARSEESPSTVRADVEARESAEAFVTEVDGLSREASRELLSRLAGQNGASNGSSAVQDHKSSRVAPYERSGAAASDNFGTASPRNYGAAPSLAEERRSNRPPAQQSYYAARARTPDAPVYRGGSVRLPGAAPRTLGHQRWGVLAARTARALRGPGVLAAAPGQPGAQLLTEQVFFTLDGEMAPQALLTRLVGAGDGAPGASGQPAGRGGGGRQSSAPRAPRGETPQTFSGAGSSVFTHGDEPSSLSNQSRSPGLDWRQPGVSATAEASAPGVNTSLMSVNNYLTGAETSTTGAAVSSVVAPPLPPLLPPPLVGMPVLPVALAAAREGARDESREAAEDLDALAEKIKLILDEQARRHGIDV